MSDWRSLVSDEPWAFGARADVREGAPRDGAPLPSTTAADFPRLSELLSLSRTTDLSIDGVPYHLHVWCQDWPAAWLSPVPEVLPNKALFPLHEVLLRSFGGIVERFNEPEETWLLNMNEVLTAKQALQDASFIDDYAWAFEDAGSPIPIDVSAYYPIAWEANGNCTMIERTTGGVLVFAPDHSDDELVTLEGCPDYTLHRHRSAESFCDWVENIAGQWLRAAA